MAAKCSLNNPTSHAGAEGGPTPPPRLRQRLNTASAVSNELAKLYREGKGGLRPVDQVSKLANVLQILGRMLEVSSLEARLEKLEEPD